MSQSNSIAIIGMSFRAAGISTLAEYWRTIFEGVECIRTYTDEELRQLGVSDNLLARRDYVKRASLLDNSHYFDADFFGYAPGEAVFIDPQQRIFLEVAYHAFEDAGCDPSRYKGAIGVFSGAGINNYLMKNILRYKTDYESTLDFSTIISNDKDYVASRVAYKLNLRGPAIDIQTACSTSLVAVQLAYQSLLTYGCDIALAGGVSLQTPRLPGYIYREGEIFSSDGICRPFDKDANGTILGEGAGAVVLKRLEDAVADHDSIYAVIKGAAVNNDGKIKLGFTAPSIDGQAEVIGLAQAIAGVDAFQVKYVETHGTATALGDSIEINGLTKAFRQSTKARGFCALGSVKANIGHLDVAAGIAGLIKAALCLYHKKIPPLVNFVAPNPHLTIENTPFYCPKSISDWESPGGLRIAGVSSFGIGGTNAHIVLEEAPKPDIERSNGTRHLFVFSAKSSEVLQRMSANLADHLESHPELDEADVAYTLAAGRSHYAHRSVTVWCNKRDGVRFLRNPDQTHCGTFVCSTESRPIVLLFSGQGTQYPGMCRGLYESEAVFRGVVDRCAKAAQDILGRDLRELLLQEIVDEHAEEEINQTAIAQPALFAVECGLSRLWRERGITPTALVGHSIGELAAACEAGVFTLDDGARIAAIRGSLMQSMPPGTMIAIPLGPSDLEPLLNPDCVIAVVNGPSISVVSGPVGAIDRLGQTLDGKEIKYRKLHTSHAFHSPMMDGAVGAFVKEIGGFRFSAPSIPFTSNVTGRWITVEEATDARYWGRQLRATVQFAQCLHRACDGITPVFLEVGPGNTLVSIARQQDQPISEFPGVASVRHPRQRVDDETFFLRAYGMLWAAGVDIDLASTAVGKQRWKVAIPGYPFKRTPYWHTAVEKKIPQAAERGWRSFVHRKIGTSSPKVEERAGSTQEVLTCIWREVLGVERVGPNDDFFELGGHSLMAAQVFAKINVRLGRSFPLSTLFEAPTIAQLTARLERGTEAEAWRPLVPLSKEGSRPPLYLVHAGEGNLLIYRYLTQHCKPDQPLFGFQSRGLDKSGQPFDKLESMAAWYVERLLAHQPKGPYFLGGYCMGGMLALEMAQRLTGMGHEIPLLLLLESYSYRQCDFSPSPFALRYQKIQEIAFNATNIVRSLRMGNRTFFDRKVQNISVRLNDYSRRKFAARLSKKMAWRVNSEGLSEKTISAIHDRLYYAYEPKPYTGRVVVIRPRRQFAGYRRHDCGWGGLVHPSPEVHVLPVDPRGMFYEPFVSLLAPLVKKILSVKNKDAPI